MSSVYFALQTLTLDVFEPGRIAPWVKELASKMKGQHRWEDFTGLTLKRVSGRDGEQIIQRDDMERWCEENIGGELVLPNDSKFNSF